MNYLNKLIANKVAIYKNLIISATRSASTTNMEATDKQPIDKKSHSSDEEEDSQAGDIEPGQKRAKMPKKSKYRTRAHMNPMSEMKFPL